MAKDKMGLHNQASTAKKTDDKIKSKKKSVYHHMQKAAIDYTPKPFVSANLSLIPPNLMKVVEFLLFVKPNSLEEALRHSSALQLRLPNRSLLTLSDMKRTRGIDTWQSVTSFIALGKGGGLPSQTETFRPGGAPSLYRLRSDPWPEPPTYKTTFTVTIRETPTLNLFSFSSRAAIEGTDRATAIHEENEAYWLRVKTYKKMYNVETQTPAALVADRWLSMSKNMRKDSSVQAYSSYIYDDFKKYEKESCSKDYESDGQMESDRQIFLYHDFDNTSRNELSDDKDEFSEACKIVDIVESGRFFQSCQGLLRSLDQNMNWRKQIIFKKGNCLDPLSSDCSITYDMDHLWTLRFIFVWGMPVTCLCLNTVNPDILAVGHGMYFMDQPQHLGRVCIWSIKNCSLPEKHFDCKDGVTSLCFSRKHPSALLVSLISGLVLIVDISKPVPEILISSGDESTNEPIWQVRWFTFDSGNEEPVACGDNGEVYLLSKINFGRKKFLNLSKREGAVKGIALPKGCRKPVYVSDKPSIMCIAPNPDNCYTYLVGTDDGCVHLCSSDYWHEHTDVFQAHIGPVHHIKYHPDCSKIFLTVGIDYSVRIWAFGVFQPLVSLWENDHPIEDADWSPANPNIVATVSSDRVSLWDISRKKLVSQGSIASPTGSRFTSVHFTNNGFNLICGDVLGDTHVYSLSHMPFVYFNKGLVLRRTFKRLLVGKKDLFDKLKTVGYPFDSISDGEI